MSGNDWENVLVVQTSFLGDTVLTLPLLSEIRSRFPNAKLTLLCSPAAGELLALHPDIDEILIDDKRHAHRGLNGLWRQSRILKQKGFTLALSPHKSLRTALLLFLARIPFRVGFRQSKGAFLYQSRVNRDPRRHDVQRNLSLLEAFGIALDECRQSVELPALHGAEERVRKLFDAAGVDRKKMLVGVNPGSVWATKRWSPRSFADLIGRLKQDLNCEVVLFGGPEDETTVAQIQELCGYRIASVAGKTSLRDLPAAVGACQLFITNDSGPMHIAVARQVPVVAIFCATTPSLGFYPYSSHAVVVEKRLGCRPCSSHGGRRCPLGTEDCIRLILPDHVLQAAKQLLQCADETAPVLASGHQPRYLSV
jgi:heptosyltransferase-2